MASARKPPPRRKSCTECIKSKRRCDQGLPSCTRCRKLKLECNYVASTRILSPNETLLPSTSDSLGTSLAQVSSPLAPQGESLVNSIDPSLINSNDLTACHLLSELDGNFSINLDDHNLPAPTLADHPMVRHVNQEIIFGDVSTIIASRFKYGIDQLNSGPKEMVLKTQTAWSHPLLYEGEMPPSLQDAHAACALYIAKHEANAHVVLRHVRTRLEGLLASPAPVGPCELLAKAHALVLYCIMLFFDGGVLERARAEAALEQLESSAIALYPLVGIIDPIPETLSYYPTASTTSIWKTWIFRESVRRTFLTCYFFISMCHVMREQFHYCSSRTAFSSIWTASAHLWSARNLLEFTTVWNERNHYVVHGLDLTEIIGNAHADDVDEFGRMLLVAHMGADDARGWFHTRGGVL
ncbi:hypothetical protein EV356DRAFT_483337 [Viridothelium virens]|uniref:Zn(2)-C6 fungal-type domain-containing protein n=1 Tax=Viridothelium virens TaxID=1048519 RepID=A0A6A6HBR9_VIRVR|nr:hypothetical protein EV356DRAFT_483337 [Viridothelium virens]